MNVIIPPAHPEYVNFFKTISILAGDHLVVSIGVSHISSRLQKYNQGIWRKRTKNKRGLGLTQVQEGQVCDTGFPVHM